MCICKKPGKISKTKGLSREGNNSPTLKTNTEAKRDSKVRAQKIKNSGRHKRRTYKRAGEKGLARLIVKQSERRAKASSNQE